MNAICFTFVTLLTYVFSLHVFEPPKLQILSTNATYAASDEGKVIDIYTGSSLTLRCSGNRPIEWTFPIQDNNKDADNINVTDSCEKSGDENVCSTDLLITELVFQQTGLYSCYYNESNDEHLSDSVYVFVNDKNHLCLNDFNNKIDVWYPTKPIILPCLPTYSYANVTLQYSLIDNEERKNLTLDEDQGITYDPTKGLVIQKSNVSIALRYYCTVRVNELIGENVFIITMGSNSGLDVHVSLQLTNRLPILTGDTLEFVCAVDTPKASELSIDFTLPVTDTNVTITEIVNETLSLNMVQFRRYSRKLIVQNVTRDYEGVYYCNVSQANEVIAGEYQTVSIYDESSQKIDDISTDSDLDSHIIKKSGDNMNVVFTVTSNYQVKFSDLSLFKDGKMMSKGKKDKILKIKGDKILVEMSNMSARESGIYELVVHANRKTIHKKFFVDVKTITINSSSNEYEKNSMFTIICTANGNPIPEIDAFFYPCVGKDNCTNTKYRRWVNKFVTGLTGNNELYSYKVIHENKTRVLEIRGEAKKSGYYECLAKSISGNEYARLKINVIGESNKSDSLSINYYIQALAYVTFIVFKRNIIL